MEALLEREGKVENWNDDRLDELSQTMKEGFARVNDRLDKLFYIQIFFVTTLAISLLTDKISF
jgi:hypothetical protein